MIVKLSGHKFDSGGKHKTVILGTSNHNYENWSIFCQSLNKTHPSINRVNYHYHDNGVVMLLEAVSLFLTPLLHGGELVFIGAFLSTRGKGGREGVGKEGGKKGGRKGGRERGREGEREEEREGGREGGREREREQ